MGLVLLAGGGDMEYFYIGGGAPVGDWFTRVMLLLHCYLLDCSQSAINYLLRRDPLEL